MSNSQSRKWTLVINNPLECEFTHERICEILMKFFPDYFCLADEIAKTGTFHTHIFIYSHSPIRFNTIKNRFPIAHIEKALGSAKDNRDYILKSGKWENDEKSETSVEGSFYEYGTLPKERDENNPKMSKLIENIRDGKQTTEIIDDAPEFAFRIRDIDALRQVLSSEKYLCENRDLYVTYIFGASGTGKTRSILLKLLIMQCVKKDAEVFIADFKGGVDFLPVWHERCNIITEENTLLEILTGLVNELENRKQGFREYGCANISEYNKMNAPQIKRIVFACDEVAEVLDKTGFSKEAKELVTQIEGKLSIIARQGRAFGIHLILATQRPDANILAGQIRNNIDFRVCGRADNILSQIILDNTNAAEQIPKDSQGLFITHDGVIFKGYLFDEKAVFDR